MELELSESLLWLLLSSPEPGQGLEAQELGLKLLYRPGSLSCSEGPGSLVGVQGCMEDTSYTSVKSVGPEAKAGSGAPGLSWDTSLSSHRLDIPGSPPFCFFLSQLPGPLTLEAAPWC